MRTSFHSLSADEYYNEEEDEAFDGGEPGSFYFRSPAIGSSPVSWYLLLVRIYLLSIVIGGFYYTEIRALFLLAAVLVTLSIVWCFPIFY